MEIAKNLKIYGFKPGDDKFLHFLILINYKVFGKIWKGEFKGQTQTWFLAQFIGKDDEIKLDQKNPEFKKNVENRAKSGIQEIIETLGKILTTLFNIIVKFISALFIENYNIKFKAGPQGFRPLKY